MDELIKELVKRAGLTAEQAKTAAEVVLDWLKHDDNRKKVAAITAATAVAARVV